MASINFRNISKSFGNKVVLRDIDISVDDGEFLVLLGPSGCGKSTLLRMLAGLESVSGGEILIGDKRVDHLPPGQRDMAFVFQSYALYPHLSVRRNMVFPLLMERFKSWYHLPVIGSWAKRRIENSPEIARKVERTAEILALGEMLDMFPRTLSGGQRQRVALGRAMVREPAVFLMDEPLSNLDAKLRVSTRAQIKHLSHELGVTTIYVTHDQIEAMTLADRVVVMKAGIVQQVGTPTEIYDRPANTFVASFIGTPAMNLMEGQVAGGVFTGENVRISGVSAPDGPLTLGFRAEDARMGQGSGQISAPIYSLELLGDATMATVRAGGAIVSIKCPKDFRAEINADFHAEIPSDAVHLFDSATGARLV